MDHFNCWMSIKISMINIILLFTIVAATFACEKKFDPFPFEGNYIIYADVSTKSGNTTSEYPIYQVINTAKQRYVAAAIDGSITYRPWRSKSL